MKPVLAAICLILSSAGCAASRLPPPGAAAPSEEFVVAPPYRDPEYVLRFPMRRPASWEERRNIDAGEDRPDPILRLTRREDGTRIEVLFLPKSEGEPADWAEHLRTTFGGTAAVSTDHGGDRSTVDTAAGDTRSRHVVLHMRGMARSLAYVRLTAPAPAFDAATADLRTVVDGMRLVPTGPLPPQGRLAACLTDRGVRLYSTWWCGPCQMQHRLFGEGASRVDTTQCSDPGETDQRPVCARARISSYPTWTFPDGSRLEGVQSLEDLAAHAGCPRPPAE